MELLFCELCTQLKTKVIKCEKRKGKERENKKVLERKKNILYSLVGLYLNRNRQKRWKIIKDN